MMYARKLLPLLFLLPVLPAGAQDIPAAETAADSFFRRQELGEVVVTGVAAPVRIQDALSLYRVIDEAQFRAQGSVTLADALATQLGLQLSADPVLGASVQVQGLQADKVKILIDGLPVNGRENGSVDLGQLNLARVARIEIVQGPMSVKYGSDALGGVINLITKRATGPRIELRSFVESVGRYNADATVAWSLKDRHAFELTAGRNYFAGWGQADTGELQRRLLYKPKTQHFGTVAYNYTAPSGFKLSAASDLFQEKITDRGSAYVDPYRAYGLDQKFFVTRSMNRLQLEGLAGKGAWSLSNSYNIYHRVRESVEKNLETLQETPLLAAGAQDTSRFDELNMRSNYARTVGAFRLDGGYDIVYQTGQSGKLDSTSGETARYTQSDFAIYANAGWNFWKDKATLQAGLRAAINTQYNAPLVPAFNLLLKPKENLQIRASFAEGFRAPTLKELHLRFVDQNHEIIGNPNLRAERSCNYQLSVSHQKTFAQKVRTRATLSGYFNDVRDGITLANPSGNPAGLQRIYSNLAQQQTAIGQLQLQGDYKSLQVLAGGGLTHVLGQNGAYEGFTVPEVTGQSSYRWKKIATTFTAFYKYTGAGRQLSADAEGNALYGGRTVSFQQVDLSAQRAFWKDRISLTAGVKNMLNIQTQATAGVVAAGGHTAAGALAPLPRRVFVQLAVGLVR